MHRSRDQLGFCVPLCPERLRKRQTENEGDLEMMENVTNPLHCPVRLYEFYLSRWWDSHTNKFAITAAGMKTERITFFVHHSPESVKKKTNMFYLQPEQNVHTHRSERRYYPELSCETIRVGVASWIGYGCLVIFVSVFSTKVTLQQAFQCCVINTS